MGSRSGTHLIVDSDRHSNLAIVVVVWLVLCPYLSPARGLSAPLAKSEWLASAILLPCLPEMGWWPMPSHEDPDPVHPHTLLLGPEFGLALVVCFRVDIAREGSDKDELLEVLLAVLIVEQRLRPLQLLRCLSRSLDTLGIEACDRLHLQR